jgi:aminopeptidase N
MGPDASNTTHPITTSVYSPVQINSIFDAISYQKGQ